MHFMLGNDTRMFLCKVVVKCPIVVGGPRRVWLIDFHDLRAAGAPWWPAAHPGRSLRETKALPIYFPAGGVTLQWAVSFSSG